MIYKSVHVRAPLRVSLAGGGCDFPKFFNQYESTPITSIAIDSYVYVTARRLSNFYEEKFRLEYYEVEHCNSIDQIKNNLIRGVLTHLNWDEPVHISLSSDIPGFSGLGTSSSFCVALIGALKFLRGDPTPSSFGLAKNTIEVELNVLNLPMGVQDALPASFGGFHTYSLHKGGNFSVTKHDENCINSIINKGHVFLVWSGSQRASKSVLEEQIKSIEKDDDSYKEMRNLAIQFADQIRDVNDDPIKLINLLGNTLHHANALKNRVVGNLYNEKSQNASKRLFELGINAQRVVGAGNGGFILCISNQANANYRLIEREIGKIISPNVSSSGFEIIFSE